MRTVGISDKVLVPLAAAPAVGLVLVGAGLVVGVAVVWQIGLGVIGAELGSGGIAYRAAASPVELEPDDPVAAHDRAHDASAEIRPGVLRSFSACSL